MLDAAIQSVQDYYNEIPDNTMVCVGTSAVFSFVVAIITHKGTSIAKVFQSSLEDFRRPLFAATCAAMASLIHGLMTPFFNRIFGDNDQNKILREVFKWWFDVSLLKLSLLTVVGDVEEISARITFVAIGFFRAAMALSSDFADLFVPPTPTSPSLKPFFQRWGLLDPNSSNSYLAVCY